MKILTIICLLLSLTLSAQAKKKTEKITWDEPIPNYVAIAAVNHLKRVQTVGGFLVWAERFIPSEEIASMRKWLAKHDIEENQYFPNFQFKNNKMYLGRDSIVFNEDHFVINNKRYSFKQQPFVKFVDKVCKQINCVGAKTSSLNNLFIPEAQALTLFAKLALAFIGGFFVGHKWGDKITGWFRGGRSNRGNYGYGRRRCQGNSIMCGAGEILRDEIMDGGNNKAQCDSGNVVVRRRDNGEIVMFNKRGGFQIPTPKWAYEKGRSCESIAREMNNSVMVYNDKHYDEDKHGRSGASEKQGHPSRRPNSIKNN